MNAFGILVGKPVRLAAVLLTAALAVAAAVAGLGGTFAAPSDIVVDLQNESGIPAEMTLAVGETQQLSVSYLYGAYSSHSDIAAIEYTEGSSFNNIRIQGKAAGFVTITFGTKRGLLAQNNYLVTDSRNISKYTIKNNGEMYFAVPKATGAPGNPGAPAEPGTVKPSPVTVREGTAGTIVWSSLNEKVAKVGTDGTITAVGKGATAILGSFTDKWGAKRILHILVGVGVYLSADNMQGELLELIARGEEILAEKDASGESPYTNASQNLLSSAVAYGRGVMNFSAPPENQVQTAIDALKDAIGNMQPKPKEGFTITSIMISPPANLTYVPWVVAGGTMQFEAIIQGEGNFPRDVTWQVSGNKSSGTSISAGGLLTIAPDESATGLAIHATSTADSTKTTHTGITISYPESDVTISPAGPIDILAGGTQAFSATLDVTGEPTHVIWKVIGAKAGGTNITTAGVLTVAADEPAGQITVQCSYQFNLGNPQTGAGVGMGEKPHDITVNVKLP